ncbi:MAG: hypothetical protein ACI9YB_000826, partial [Halioglobus sp.]
MIKLLLSERGLYLQGRLNSLSEQKGSNSRWNPKTVITRQLNRKLRFQDKRILLRKRT